ncbi:hypothetical protein VCRA2122O12_150032 [Vibrio crassostreae]|nr:hypothetical protein VCRA2110O1_150066 [Vibrio crassostreae]CAK1778401.1 hypothetical protein VCRA2110O4_150065 [Vibrio crassostreae]CAK1817719.1 hypothetical protein VCRA2114E5_170066 [Vibrio crassostreae]CAK2318498.1 hypothetical protein VCRA2111O408_290013 [Vibrio crassostreae]CAK2335354.1 hypothetical protein VCRA211O406_290013 [Vibrio crassostreae]
MLFQLGYFGIASLFRIQFFYILFLSIGSVIQLKYGKIGKCSQSHLFNEMFYLYYKIT